MMRLIEKGLMYGNLFPVASPGLIARYNNALKSLTGKTTKLTDFHIDISGYSPEIGDELGDPLYLNPNGCNRQFILLSTDQKSCPLLNAQFSTSHGILNQFIEANESQLFALTTRDAVAGELLNSVLKIDIPARLLDIRQIDIEADTTGALLVDSAKLDRKIKQFRKDDDAWWDDVLIAEMIALAKKTGDITRNPVNLNVKTFQQANFWTAHFGGLYIFRDVEHPASISNIEMPAKSKIPIARSFTFKDRNEIATFLELNDLADTLINREMRHADAILRQKMDFILVDVAADGGDDLTGLDRRELRNAARKHLSKLPDEYHALNDLVRWVEGGGKWPRITSEHPAYFYTLRASQTPERDLVNMMLAELTPLDARALFICHKEAFYRAYATWGDEKRSFVSDFLAREYAIDKEGMRDMLFGAEPPMAPPPPAKQSREDRIAAVGPWGAVRRRK
jgi:hypothetical protein